RAHQDEELSVLDVEGELVDRGPVGAGVDTRCIVVDDTSHGGTSLQPAGTCRTIRSGRQSAPVGPRRAVQRTVPRRRASCQPLHADGPGISPAVAGRSRSGCGGWWRFGGPLAHGRPAGSSRYDGRAGWSGAIGSAPVL